MERKFAIGTQVSVTLNGVEQTHWGRVFVSSYQRNNTYKLHLVDKNTTFHASEHQIREI